MQGPSATRLLNGDVVIYVNSGNTNPNSNEGINALYYPSNPAQQPRWYPIYGANVWGNNPALNEFQFGWPTVLYFANAWRVVYFDDFYHGPSSSTNWSRTGRSDLAAPTSQPTATDTQWLKPDPQGSNHCEVLGNCAGPGLAAPYNMTVQDSAGVMYAYHGDGNYYTCSHDPNGAHTIGTIRHRINSDLSYTPAGCVSFNWTPGATFTPLYPTDISRGTDGKYYMLASHFPFVNGFGEWVSPAGDGLQFTYNNRWWTVDCGSVPPSPDCNLSLNPTCFAWDATYLRDSTGLIVEPRVVIGVVGNEGAAVDGSWRLYYWADDNAVLPATWGQDAPSCPPPYVVSGASPSYQGNFDGFSASMQTASGWAWDWYQPNTVQGVSVFVDSNLFTTLSANQLRGDLLNPPPHYYYGNGVHGWAWPIASFFRDGLQHTIDVRYTGSTSVSNSPRTYKIAAPSSASVSPTSLTGGASATLTINLTQAAPSGGLTTLLSSSNAAAVVPASKLVTGSSGTATVTTSPVAGVTTTTLRASAGNVTKSATLTIVPSAPVYAGYFDTLDCNAAVGWAWNQNFPNSSIGVDIFDGDGATLIAASVPASFYRADLPGNHFHQFIFNLPASLKNNASHILRVKVAGTNVSLANNPRMVTCAQLDTGLALDIHAAAGSTGNLNGVLEPGESVSVEPKWQNKSSGSVSLTGTATAFQGDVAATYTIADSNAAYGPVAPNAMVDCYSATPAHDCYRLTINSPPRTLTHWDSYVTDTTNSPGKKVWVMHVGKSFTDVDSGPTNLVYSAIETIFHRGITAGCSTGTTYCPTNSVTRAEMAVFLVKVNPIYGPAYVPPAAIGVFSDVPPAAFAANYIEQLYRDGISAGCGGGNYCPIGTTTRAQMAVFLLKTKHGSAYNPPNCTGVFSDVLCPGTYTNWIEQLNAENAVALGSCVGAGPTKYCPNDPTTRGQMAGFMTKTFGLTLYGP